MVRHPWQCLAAGTLLSIALSLPTSASAAGARVVGGVELPWAVLSGTHKLVYNGAGIRSRFFFKLYVGALYLESKSAEATTIVNADRPMALTLDILSGKVTRDKLAAALEDGFRKATGGDTAPIQAGIDRMLSLVQDKVVPGDRFSLSYRPETGTRVSKNDRELAIIEGLAFKQALFGIWLGDDPVQRSLKDAMLGS